MLWRQLKAIAPFPGMATVVIPGVIVVTMGRGDLATRVPLAIDVVAVAAGVVLLALGLGLFCWTVTLFARQGQGTLSPLDAPRRLVVSGPYRHVRNPMYAAVFGIQLGEALALRAWTLAAWFVCFFVVIAVFVARKEEGWLQARFSADYEQYRTHVPRWIPRARPWAPRG